MSQSEELPSILWNTDVHYHKHNSRQMSESIQKVLYTSIERNYF